MRKFLWALVVVLMATAAAGVAALAAALQGEAAVAWRAEPDAGDVARALQLVRAHDPRRSRPGTVSALQLSERDVEVLANHVGRRWLEAATRVAFERGVATVTSSLHLPPNPFGRWLNLRASLVETGGLPVLDTVELGNLPLPAWLAERLAWRLVQRAGLALEMELAADVVRRVSFRPQRLAVVYAWRDDSAQRVLGALSPAVDAPRLRAYTERLAQVVAQQGAGWTVSLAPLLGPVFALAAQRSAEVGADAAAENRAALVVLTLYVNGRGVDALLPAARSWSRARPLRVTLGGRDDFPRHLLVSAALAAEGTGPLSKAIGVYKELADARGGTGFSFKDMAANRAGTRLGERAVAQPRQLQATLARGVQETDLLPAWADLPEFMPETEFQRRYGGVGAPAYETLLAEIDRRVGALALFR